MRLRDYQIEAVDKTFDWFRTHTDAEENPVIAMPTGTGKAIVIAGMCKRILMQWNTQRVMMLTHVKELIDQNADKLKTFWPQAPLGIFSAGLGQKMLGQQITFGGVQSVLPILRQNPMAFGKIDILMIDECHLLSPNENAAYQQIIKILRKINPWLRVIGLSATPYRLGLGMITDGGIFTHMSYDVTGLSAFNWFIDEGYLSPLIPMPTETQLDVSNVGKRGGEFIQNEVQKAVVKWELTFNALAEAAMVADKRHHWLIFASGIEHVEMAIEILGQLGISAAGVHSKMSSYERDDNLARFKAGQVRALVNADILTTGFDFPGLDCIILLRPTSSPVLHVQILGRGTRPLFMDGFDMNSRQGRLDAIAASYKQSCLVLDFAGNTQRLGPINDPRIPKRKGAGTGDIPLKVCSSCGCLNHISARECINPECDEEFVFDSKIEMKASTLALIVRDEPQVELFTVDRVTYAKHSKAGAIPSLKVSYFCGMRRFSEWVCLAHHGNPIQRKAWDWWRERDDTGSIWQWEIEKNGEIEYEDRQYPPSIDDALEIATSLRVPTQLRVWVNLKYPKIMSYVYEKEPENA